MKNSGIILIAVCCMVATIASAQFTTAPKDPYTSAVPTILNTGRISQTKKGGAAVLGIRLGESTISDGAWIGQLSTQGMPGFAVDTPILVYRHSITGIDSDWRPTLDVFGFDTNTPISVNGLWSSGVIMSPNEISTQVLGYDVSSYLGPSSAQILMCSINTTGGITACAQQAKPSITLSAEPRSVSSSNPRPVTLSWSASDVDECHAVSGPGFFADKQLIGTDESNIIQSSSGSSVLFTIACTNSLGTVAFQSAQVSVQ